MKNNTNPERGIKVEKITLNMGAGKSTDKLDKGLNLLKKITNRTPVKTFTKKRIAAWGLRPGLPIGCKVTLRKDEAVKLIPVLLEATDFVLSEKQFDNNGNISFGVKEYIDIPQIKYDPDIGIMGFEVCITLQRPGFRIKRRRLKPKKINSNHSIRKEEAMKFMKSNFNVKLAEEIKALEE